MTKQNDRISRKLISGGVTIILIIAVCLCLVTFIQVLHKGYVSLFGYSFFKVTTGSMEPTIHVGALLLTKNEPIEAVEINDIISFFSKEAYMKGRIITHRVVASEESVTGQVMLTTRGDANSSTDIHRVDKGNYIGKVIWISGEDNIFAKLMSFLSGGVGFFSCIAIPAILISVSIFRSCMKEILLGIEMLKKESGYQDDYDEEHSDPQNSSVPPQDSTKAELTSEEYEQMYERIRAELIEELKTKDDREETTE